MGNGDRFRRLADDLKKRIGERGRGNRVNFAGRVNKAVSVNSGSDNSTQGVSSKQRTRIRQDGEETYEESETSQTTFGEGGANSKS